MNAQALAIVFQSATALIAIFVLLLWLWPAARLDRFRQDMFAVRDELFDYGRSGKIRFSDPAYRLLRQLMNGFIRYAHQLTFFRVCMMSLMWMTLEDKPRLEWSENWNKAVKDIKDEEVRKDLTAFHDRVCALALQRLLTGSPVLLALVFLAIVLGLCHAGLKSLKSTVSKAVTETTSKVIDARLLQEEAARSAA
jgi:hypothetical protein